MQSFVASPVCTFTSLCYVNTPQQDQVTLPNQSVLLHLATSGFFSPSFICFLFIYFFWKSQISKPTCSRALTSIHAAAHSRGLVHHLNSASLKSFWCLCSLALPAGWNEHQCIVGVTQARRGACLLSQAQVRLPVNFPLRFLAVVTFISGFVTAGTRLPLGSEVHPLVTEKDVFISAAFLRDILSDI